MRSPPRPRPNEPDTFPADQQPAAPKRAGLDRLLHALGYALAGLRQGWREPAFRQEALAAVVLVPTGLWLGSNWVERTLLVGSVLLVMIVELLNTAIESAVDRIGAQWHVLAKRAKDTASAAVLLTLLLCGLIWLSAIWARFL